MRRGRANRRLLSEFKPNCYQTLQGATTDLSGLVDINGIMIVIQCELDSFTPSMSHQSAFSVPRGLSAPVSSAACILGMRETLTNGATKVVPKAKTSTVNTSCSLPNPFPSISNGPIGDILVPKRSTLPNAKTKLVLSNKDGLVMTFDRLMISLLWLRTHFGSKSRIGLYRNNPSSASGAVGSRPTGLLASMNALDMENSELRSGKTQRSERVVIPWSVDVTDMEEIGPGSR